MIEQLKCTICGEIFTHDFPPLKDEGDFNVTDDEGYIPGICDKHDLIGNGTIEQSQIVTVRGE